MRLRVRWRTRTGRLYALTLWRPDHARAAEAGGSRRPGRPPEPGPGRMSISQTQLGLIPQRFANLVHGLYGGIARASLQIHDDSRRNPYKSSKLRLSHAHDLAHHPTSLHQLGTASHYLRVELLTHHTRTRPVPRPGIPPCFLLPVLPCISVHLAISRKRLCRHRAGYWFHVGIFEEAAYG